MWHFGFFGWYKLVPIVGGGAILLIAALFLFGSTPSGGSSLGGSLIHSYTSSEAGPSYKLSSSQIHTHNLNQQTKNIKNMSNDINLDGNSISNEFKNTIPKERQKCYIQACQTFNNGDKLETENFLKSFDNNDFNKNYENQINNESNDQPTN